MNLLNTTVIIFIVLLSVYIMMPKEFIEGYFPFRYCRSCGYRSRRQCNKCTNCGFCVPYRGKGNCVPGDNRGPYFRSDCVDWEYGDEYIYRDHPRRYRRRRPRSSYFRGRRKPWYWSPRRWWW